MSPDATDDADIQIDLDSLAAINAAATASHLKSIAESDPEEGEVLEEGEVADEDDVKMQSSRSASVTNEAVLKRTTSISQISSTGVSTYATSPAISFPATSPSPATLLHTEEKKFGFSSSRFKGCSFYSCYERMDKVGEGTFGEVHKARHSETGQYVAVKKILMHNEKEGFPITALREIKILKTLKHVNVVHLQDITCAPGKSQHDRGNVYMVFPYMDHDLMGLLDSPDVRFSLPQIKYYVQQLLSGLWYLHKNKILHRDLKCANLLVNNSGILQIADFGLARPLDETRLHYTNGVVTRWYRPPELLLGSTQYSSDIDMWGAGCIIAEMFTRKPILPGQSDAHQLELIAKLCGTPSETNMPGVSQLPDFNKVQLGQHPRRVREAFKSFMDKDALDLVDKLLTLHPKQRLDAHTALDHAWFWTEPLPFDPSKNGPLPIYSSSHEYDRRLIRQAQHQAAVERSAMRSRTGQQQLTPVTAPPGTTVMRANGQSIPTPMNSNSRSLQNTPVQQGSQSNTAIPPVGQRPMQQEPVSQPHRSDSNYGNGYRHGTHQDHRQSYHNQNQPYRDSHQSNRDSNQNYRHRNGSSHHHQQHYQQQPHRHHDHRHSSLRHHSDHSRPDYYGGGGHDSHRRSHERISEQRTSDHRTNEQRTSERTNESLHESTSQSDTKRVRME